MEILFSGFIALLLFISGAFALLGYMILRMLRSSSWDDSNMTNALRLIAHMVVHPNDFAKMYYLTTEEINLLSNNGHEPRSPFWYLNKDELSEVVKTRPSE